MTDVNIAPGSGSTSTPSATPAPVAAKTDPAPVAAFPASTVDNELQRELEEALGDKSIEQLMEEASAPPPAAAPAPTETGRQEHQEFLHDLVRGRIVAVREQDVFVELTGFGGKQQGLVPLTQFERPPRMGSIMEFVVERIDEAEGLVHLSREGAISRATWEQLQRGATVEARVVSHNKGGLELEMIGGINAFMPASQIDFHRIENFEHFVGQKLPAVVQEIDRRSRKVILSRRQYLEQERQRQQEKIWAQLEEGQIREGKIASLVEYGAFVDLGGLDGLIHISDLSYSRVDKSSDIVAVGQDVKVKVLKVDREKKRVSLGLKQVAPDPWDTSTAQINVGQQVTGRIVRIADFGAFVEVVPGVEGLLPISEMSWKRIGRATEVVKEGDSLRLKVIALEVAKRRMTLSLKQASGDPWIGTTVKYAPHTLVEGTALRTTDFGAFIELESGVEGLVHISELTDKHVNMVTDVIKVGEKYQLRVLEVDEPNRRIRLSLKAAKHAPPTEPVPTPGTPTATAKPAQKKKIDKNLKGGIVGGNLGIGLGQLKL